MLKENIISVKDYHKIGKSKDLEIETEKMWHLKTSSVPVIMEALGRIKKGTDNHKPGSPGLYNMQNSQFMKLLILSVEK